MAMSDVQPERVNVARAMLITRVFHFFLAGANITLIPFLPIFFRILGLSALQVGLLVAAKAFTGCIIAPIWSKCATKCNKRKGVLVFSLIMMMMANMALMLVPATGPEMSQQFCQSYNESLIVTGESMHDNYTVTVASPHESKQSHDKQDEVPPTKSAKPGSKSSHGSMPTTKPTEPDSKFIQDKVPPTKADSNPAQGKNLSNKPKETSSSPKKENIGPPSEKLELIKTHKPVNIVKEHSTTTTTTTVKPTSLPDNGHKASGSPKKHKSKGKKHHTTMATTVIDESDMWTTTPTMGGILGLLSPRELELLHEVGFSNAILSQMNEKQLQQAVEDLVQEAEREKEEQSNNHGRRAWNRRYTRDIIQSTISKLQNSWSGISAQMDKLQYKTFFLALVIILLGELLASQTMKVADDMWFSFTDGLDIIEKYHQHVPWATVAMIAFAPIVTSIVDHTPCLLPSGLHHIMIHFFVCASLISVAFILALCFPTYTGKKVKNTGGLWRGLRLAFSDAHSITITFTLFITGIVSAFHYIFLFWRIQDMGGSELVMGCGLAVAFFSELLMYFFQRWLVKKSSHATCIGIALGFYSARLIYYSFLCTPWSPWLLLPGEAFHCFSHTLLWGAVQLYPDFRSNPSLMDRSVNAVLIAVHHGIGFAGGSILAGFLHDIFGLSTLFQGAAVGIFIWTIIFGLVHKCVKRKHKIRYSKLLQAEDEYSNDDEEDDWLEVALKDSKYK